jgi:putative ABC transport system permease protein
MSGPTLIAMGLAIAIYVLLAVAALRHRLLGRIAAREAIRRPVQSAVVIAGLTIGTATILGPQAFYDSLFDSLVASVDRSWGRIDITVSAGGAPFGRDVAERVAAGSTNEPTIAGVQPGVDRVVSAADQASRLGASAARFVGFDPGAQRPFGAFVLDDGSSAYGDQLVPGQVWVNQSLADDLRARRGDRLRVESGGRASDLVVAGTVRPDGPGALGLRPAIFGSLETAAMVTGSDAINVVWITAAGDGGAERDATPVAAMKIRSLVAGLAVPSTLDVREVKTQEAAAYTDNQAGGHALALIFGLFAMAVGIALVVNITLSLAEERRPRLALLRAIGLSRTGLVTISMLEGALYTVAAAVLGVALGTAYAQVMTVYADNALLDSVNGRAVPMGLSLRPDTVASAVAIGALVTLLTMFVAALRSSRMTIVSAIRDLPEPSRVGGRSRLRIAMLIALGLAGVFCVIGGGAVLRIVGGWAVIGSGSGLARGYLPDRTRASVAGLLLVAWALVLYLSEPPASNTLDVTFQLFVLVATTVVVGLSLLAAANLRFLEGIPALFGRYATRVRGTLRPPLAYMTRRPLRAGLTSAALGLVILMITVIAVIAAIPNRPETARDAGGFDVVATSSGSQTMELPASIGVQVARTVSIPTRHYAGPQRVMWPSGALVPDWHDESIALHELSDAVLGAPIARLSQRDPRFASDEEAFRAVASDPTWIIASYGSQGGKLWIVGRDGPVERKIAGSFAVGFLDGITGSRQALAPFSGLPAGTTLLVQAKPGTDLQGLVQEIRTSMFSDGVDAATTTALLEHGQVQSRTAVELFRLWIVAGLLAGVLSVGVLTLRAALERRRAIGTLRALGAQRRSIMGGLLMEALLTAAVGITVGLVATLVILKQLVETARPGMTVVGDWAGNAFASIALLYGLILLVALVVSVGPAFRASRLSPIEALRD